MSPEDFEGLSFGVAASDVQTATFEALGADVGTLGRPNQAGSDGFEGLETMWWTYVANGLWLTYPFVTENAALWPRTSVIVADTDRFEELDEADREIQREAAAEATSWSVEHASDRVLEERESMCAMGARVVTASPAQLDALRGAAQPAYDTIREDPVQADHLAALEELLAGVEAEPVPLPPGCAYQPGDEERILAYQAPEPIDGPGRPGDLPAGTYRYSVTEEEVMTYGLMNEEGARANAGVWTWTLGDGSWSYEMEPSSDDVPEGYAGNTCEGFYDVRGSSVSFTRETEYAQGECAPPTWRAEWSESDNGLRMRVSSDGPDIDFLFGGKKWERID